MKRDDSDDRFLQILGLCLTVFLAALIGFFGLEGGPDPAIPWDPSKHTKVRRTAEVREQPKNNLKALPEKAVPESSSFKSLNWGVATQGPMLSIHFVDVGQGDCTVIRCPNGRVIMVDAGSARSPRPKPAKVRGYLEWLLPERRVDVLVVTHSDYDHYRLMPYVLREITVGKVILVDPKSSHDVGSYVTSASRTAPRGFLKWLRHQSVRMIGSGDESRPGQPSRLFGDTGQVEFHVLAADCSKGREGWLVNTGSIVLRVSYGEFSAILTGDATEPTEDYIVDKFPSTWLDCDVLKLGHHGSATTSNRERWLNVVRPEVAIASCGKNGGGFEHPGDDYREVLERHTVSWGVHPTRWWNRDTDRPDSAPSDEAVFNTGMVGSVVVESNGRNAEVYYWSD